MGPWTLIGQIFGVLVTVGCVVTAQLPKRWQLLLGLAVVNLFSALNQLFIGAGLTAAAICFLAVLHCALNSCKAKRNIPIRMWENVLFSVLYFLAWGAAFLVSLQAGSASFTDALPLLATVCFVSSVFAPHPQQIRAFSFCNSLVYCVYNLIHLNVAVVATLIDMTSLVLAMLRYRKHPEAKGEEI